MKEIVQIVQDGFQVDGDVEPTWREPVSYLVPLENRTRILGREAKAGNTPSPDGWLYARRRCDSDIGEFDAVQRIRWDCSIDAVADLKVRQAVQR